MSSKDDNKILIGDYIVIQRQNYKKLHQLKNKDYVKLGKHHIELDNIVSEEYNSTFRLLLKEKNRFYLNKVKKASKINLLSNREQGVDNRNINDDGKSQKLTSEEITKLQEKAVPATDIIREIVSNSSTFGQKTAFSQEKYVKKKEKKYYEYVQIIKPTILNLTEIYYRLSPAKIMGMRIDDLSQILYYSNVHCYGNYLIYESGTCGLPVAAILERIGCNTVGKLIHVHPGNEPQRQAIKAMKFPDELINDRYVNVNIYSVLRYYHQKYKMIKAKVDDSNTVSNMAESQPGISTEKYIENQQTLQVEKNNINKAQQNDSNVSSDIADSQSGTCTEKDIKNQQTSQVEKGKINKAQGNDFAEPSNRAESSYPQAGSSTEKDAENQLKLKIGNDESTDIADLGSSILTEKDAEKQQTLEVEKRCKKRKFSEDGERDLSCFKKKVELFENKLSDSIANSQNTESALETDTNLEVDSKNFLKKSKKDKSQSSFEINQVLEKKWQIDNHRACQIFDEKLDGIIVIAKEHPTDIINAFINFVNLSRTVVVFADNPQILTQVYMDLKQSGRVTNIRLTNTFMRQIQVLSGRTHPNVNRDFGGYLLCGYTVGEE